MLNYLRGFDYTHPMNESTRESIVMYYVILRHSNILYLYSRVRQRTKAEKRKPNEEMLMKTVKQKAKKYEKKTILTYCGLGSFYQPTEPRMSTDTNGQARVNRK